MCPKAACRAHIAGHFSVCGILMTVHAKRRVGSALPYPKSIMRKSPATNGARSSHDVCLQLYRMPSAVSTIRAVVLRDGACQARTCCWRLQWYRLRIVSWRHTGLHFPAPSVIHENHVSGTGKSVSGWRLLPLFGSFWAFCIVKQSKWRCKTVKVRLQDWLDDEPILTILERFGTSFYKKKRPEDFRKLHILLNIKNIRKV